MRVGCDLDGVLADSYPEIKRQVKLKFGVDLEEEYLGPGFELLADKYGLDQDWIYKTLFKDEWFWSRATPIQINIDTVKDWGQEHDVHILTGRPQADTAIVTKRWLKKHGIPDNNLAFEPVMHKINYIKSNNIQVMFEDMFFEANKIASFGIPCFVVRRPWNQDYEARLTNPLVRFIEKLSDADLGEL